MKFTTISKKGDNPFVFRFQYARSENCMAELRYGTLTLKKSVIYVIVGNDDSWKYEEVSWKANFSFRFSPSLQQPHVWVFLFYAYVWSYFLACVIFIGSVFSFFFPSSPDRLHHGQSAGKGDQHATAFRKRAQELNRRSPAAVAACWPGEDKETEDCRQAFHKSPCQRGFFHVVQRFSGKGEGGKFDNISLAICPFLAMFRAFINGFSFDNPWLASQEEHELVQRKFMKQIGHFAQVSAIELYPRLPVVDILPLSKKFKFSLFKKLLF